MTLWIVALVSYLAVGLGLVFVGPAARLRRRDQVEFAWRTFDQPRWKTIAFAAAIAVGIIVLWPVLIVSAARTEAIGTNLIIGDDVGPSGELDRAISELRSRYPGALPLEAYRDAADRLPWTDRPHLEKRLSKLDCVISGFAKGADERDLPVVIDVLKVGVPFSLTRMRSKGSDDYLSSFHEAPRPGDEIWEFSSSSESWQHLSGRAGIALIRGGIVADVYLTRMN